MLNFREHLEQVADMQDVLMVDVRSAPNGTIQQVRWQWTSDLPGGSPSRTS